MTWQVALQGCAHRDGGSSGGTGDIEVGTLTVASLQSHLQLN